MLDQCNTFYKKYSDYIDPAISIASPFISITVVTAVQKIAEECLGVQFLNLATAGVCCVSSLYAVKDLTNLRYCKNYQEMITNLQRNAFSLLFNGLSLFSTTIFANNAIEIEILLGKLTVTRGVVNIFTTIQNRKQKNLNSIISEITWNAFSIWNAFSRLESDNSYINRCDFRYSPPLSDGFYATFPTTHSNKSQVILEAVSDWNGALSNGFQRHNVLHKHVYYKKIDSKKSFCRHLGKAVELANQTIDYLFLRAHGSSVRMVFADSNSEKPFSIYANDPTSDYSCIEKAMSPNGHIILESCTTGGTRWFSLPNFAEWLSRIVPNRTVVASKDSVYHYSLEFNYYNITFMGFNCLSDKTVKYIYSGVQNNFPPENQFLRWIDLSIRMPIHRFFKNTDTGLDNVLINFKVMIQSQSADEKDTHTHPITLE